MVTYMSMNKSAFEKTVPFSIKIQERDKSGITRFWIEEERTEISIQGGVMNDLFRVDKVFAPVVE